MTTVIWLFSVLFIAFTFVLVIDHFARQHQEHTCNVSDSSEILRRASETADRVDEFLKQIGAST